MVVLFMGPQAARSRNNSCFDYWIWDVVGTRGVLCKRNDSRSLKWWTGLGNHVCVSLATERLIGSVRLVTWGELKTYSTSAKSFVNFCCIIIFRDGQLIWNVTQQRRLFNSRWATDWGLIWCKFSTFSQHTWITRIFAQKFTSSTLNNDDQDTFSSWLFSK